MSFPAVYAITANSLTAETFRQAPSSLISGTGVVGTGDLQVSALGTPNMSVNVAAGQIWIPGTLSSTTGFPTNLNAQTAYGLPSSFNEQGCYQAWNNGVVNVTISASDPTNPRIDIICAYVQDAQYSGSNNQGVIGVITGTPAPSPSAPSAPASAVVLAQVAVAAGASSITNGNITDERPFLIPNYGLGASVQSYTPTWTGSTTNPTIGNGTLTGRYQRMGKLCAFRAVVTAGTTTTVGSGSYSLSLPFTAVSSSEQAVAGDFYDGASHYAASGLIASGTTTVVPFSTKGGTSGSAVQVGSTSFSAGASAIIVCQGVYEVA